MEAKGKASLIYLIGECGDVVPEAPYCLEKLIDSYDTIQDADVKIALLISTMKLFFLRPPEVQRMLGRLLQKATEDVSSQDLHDRALLYYRLLRTCTVSIDPSVVKDVISTDSNLGNYTNFSEEEIDDDIRDELMKEFNSLSILYGSTAESFIAEEFQVKFVRMPAEHPLDGKGSGGGSHVDPVANYDSNDTQVVSPVLPDNTSALDTTTAAAAPPTAALAADMDLLGFGSPDPTPLPANTATFALDPAVSLSSDDYQAKWGDVSDADAHVLSVPLNTQPPSTADIETSLSQVSVLTMASGDLPDEMKFFLYAQEVGAGGALFLVQASVGKGGGPFDFLMTVKVCGGIDSGDGGIDKASKFADVIKDALSYL